MKGPVCEGGGVSSRCSLKPGSLEHGVTLPGAGAGMAAAWTTNSLESRRRMSED